MLSLGSAQAKRLTDAPEVDDNAAWSPAGTEIAFTRTVDGGRKPCTIHVMTVAAATERAIGRCLTAGTAALAWADPRHLLITDAANSDDPLRLYLLDIESGATRSLSEPPAGSFGDDFPQISSSGRIAFARQFGVNRADVFTLDARGDKGQRLTQDSGIVSGLAWDRSGDGLFYASTRGGDAGLWWVAGNGGQPQRISAGLLDYRRVSQARDANRAVVETALDSSRSMGGFSPSGLRRAPATVFRASARTDKSCSFRGARARISSGPPTGPMRQPAS
jgi:Tol biopolymer transport system component